MSAAWPAVTAADTTGTTGPSEDTAYTQGSDFLRSIGITSKGDILRVLDAATNPNSLFLDSKRSVNYHARPLSVHDDMRPVVECLRSHGLEHTEIARVISEHPATLCYSPTERLTPLFNYLSDLGVGPDAVVRRPSLLGMNVGSLQKITGYLMEVKGSSEEEIVALLDTI